jgi:hypothetical protein
VTGDFDPLNMGFIGRVAMRIINELKASTAWCMM